MTTTSDITAASRGSYIARHWRGELSLPRSYWVNGIIFGFACTVLFAGWRGFAPAFAGTPVAAIFGVAILADVAFVVWQAVGIWRAAGRYGGPRVWAILARISVVVGYIFGAIAWIRNLSIAMTGDDPLMLAP